VVKQTVNVCGWLVKDQYRVFYNMIYFVQNSVASQSLFLPQKIKVVGWVYFQIICSSEKKLGHPKGYTYVLHVYVMMRDGKLGFTRSPYSFRHTLLTLDAFPCVKRVWVCVRDSFLPF